MDSYDVKKRCISTYEQFLKDGEKAENAKHSEKGEADIVKKSMSGEVEGPKGYATLDENETKSTIDHKTLQNILWKGGWDKYFDAERKIRKLLNENYRSVSDLPPVVIEKDLTNLSDELETMADAMEALSKKIITK
jgi:hypothetical protein